MRGRWAVLGGGVKATDHDGAGLWVTIHILSYFNCSTEEGELSYFD